MFTMFCHQSRDTDGPMLRTPQASRRPSIVIIGLRVKQTLLTSWQPWPSFSVLVYWITAESDRIADWYAIFSARSFDTTVPVSVTAGWSAVSPAAADRTARDDTDGDTGLYTPYSTALLSACKAEFVNTRGSPPQCTCWLCDLWMAG